MEEKQSGFGIYRKTTLGEKLKETLDEMLEAKEITDKIYTEMLDQFDEAICKEFEDKEVIRDEFLKTKNQVAGTHVNHNHVDNIWQFTITNPTVTLNGHPFPTEMLEILAIDTHLNPHVDRAE